MHYYIIKSQLNLHSLTPGTGHFATAIITGTIQAPSPTDQVEHAHTQTKNENMVGHKKLDLLNFNVLCNRYQAEMAITARRPSIPGAGAQALPALRGVWHATPILRFKLITNS
jgi:hypothetical protein